MKRIFKGLCVILALMLCGGLASFFLNSCSESDSVSIGNEAKQANEFLGFCQLNYD